MKQSLRGEPLRASEQSVVDPTYPAPAADLNPMFLEKRVYQGSRGRVYPNPFTDRVCDEKVDKSYQAVFLENEYLRLMILPEIGGRIHIAQDKTNNYDFIYRQTVVPGAPFVETVGLPAGVAETDLLLCVRTQDGRELIRYRPEKLEETPVPLPASEPPSPEDVASSDELYVIGLHQEQYRHATRYPESYWQEAIRRDPGDARSNNALGRLLLERGQFAEAEKHFREAVLRLTLKNPNPYDGEPYYNLGMALRFRERFEEAYAAFYKAAWNYAWQSPSYYALAEIDSRHGNWPAALEHLDRSLATNTLNLKARNLKAAVLRRLGFLEEAENTHRETAALDPLDFWSRNDRILIARARNDSQQAQKLTKELACLMGGRVQTYLDIAFDYAAGGLWEEASEFLRNLLTLEAEADKLHPMLLYSLGYFARQRGDTKLALDFYECASKASPDYCFPSRLDEMIVLLDAWELNPKDTKAAYYLGNVVYDKRRYAEAIQNWEASCGLDPSFSIPWRNLGIAHYNIHHDAERAKHCYRKAFEVNPRDARLLYEVDQLSKRLGVAPQARLAVLEQHPELVAQHDDLTVELLTLYNQTGQSQKALEILRTRRFHPWEGGEGLVSGQYVTAHLLRGRDCLEAGRADEALVHFESAQCYPHNLSEGKHLLTPETHLHYFCGLAHEALGDPQGARACFEKAAADGSGHSPMTYYQALALRKLGQDEAATKHLRYLLDHATRQMEAEVKVDYFATSLPNFLLFEDDLQRRNLIDCTFLKGLAHLGLGETAQAQKAFRDVLSLDVSHLGAQEEL